MDHENDFKFRLAEFGVIDSSSTSFGTSTDSRCRYLLSQISILINKHGINCVVEEFPSGTIYGWKMLKKEHIVARAESVSKVNAAVYAIIGYCYSLGMYIRLVTPSEWQRKRNGKSEIKSWSVKEANSILKYLGSKRKLLKKEDHTADAINIAIHTLHKFKNKEWELPTLTENE